MLRPLIRPIVRPLVRGVTDAASGGVAVFPSDWYRGDTAAAALSISTYDGGNELTHPSVWDAGAGKWNGYRYWMAATPYDGADSSIENPCIYASDDLATWVAPVGITNPIESQPVGGYNSDPHLVWGLDGYLYCIWRAFEAVEPQENIYFRRSSDGVTWGDKTLMRQSLATAERLMSPAVEWDGSRWVMYAVDILPSPNKIVRLTATALDGVWSAATEVTLAMPAGRDAWHLDAKRASGKWFLLIQDTETDNTAGGNLYLCQSADGLTFTRPDDPVIPRAGNWHHLLYRSALVPKTVAGRVAFDLLYAGVGADWFLGKSEILVFDKDVFDAEPATAIAGAAASTAPYLLGDDFNRANAAVGTSSGGEAWVSSAGTLSVVDNEAAAALAENTRSYIDAGVADAYVEAKIAAHTGGTAQTWLIGRFVDASNYWRFGFNATAFIAQKLVAGEATNVKTATAFYPGSGGIPSSARLGVRFSGSEITVYYNGRVVFSFTDSANSTGTKFGIQTQNTSTKFDDFFVRSLVGGL